MKTLDVIYVIKVCLGVLAAILCLLLDVNDVFTGVAIGLLVYLGADRVLRQIFIEKVEKQSVVTKTGVGIYIITWLFLWILIYSFLQSPA
ncbi:MAG: hypothetical protein NWF14_09135 [Candidatus Bathyarchaeota archaeon]|nr:hypothetical protein [Candidatus Bathyarchaeota archaeon]